MIKLFILINTQKTTLLDGFLLASRASTTLLPVKDMFRTIDWTAIKREIEYQKNIFITPATNCP